MSEVRILSRLWRGKTPSVPCFAATIAIATAIPVAAVVAITMHRVRRAPLLLAHALLLSLSAHAAPGQLTPSHAAPLHAYRSQAALSPAAPTVAEAAPASALSLSLTNIDAASSPARSAAISFPARPLRLVAPFPAGGVADVIARLVAERMASRLGKAVDVDNRPGAAGATAGNIVAKAGSDGHTLLFNQSVILIQSGTDLMPFDVVRDFTPIVRVAVMPLFLVIDGRLPMQDAREWLAALRAAPSTYSFGSSQPGSPAHLYAEYAIRGIRNGVPLVTAKGEGVLVQEMLAGRVSACFCTFSAVQSHVKSGALRLLGVTGTERSPLAPDVPTLQESGMDGYGATAWFGVMAPARTPRAIIARLANELEDVMGEREVRDRLLAAGVTPLRDSPEAFAAAIRSESMQWQVILRQAGGPTEP